MRDMEDGRKLCAKFCHPLQSCPAFLPRNWCELRMHLQLRLVMVGSSLARHPSPSNTVFSINRDQNGLLGAKTLIRAVH
jgi:hypothetical protein